MPTNTFFNLASTKREKLLACAQAEFSRVPFAQASINRIVQAAQIPRGSFYMYFADKQDLFQHILGEYRTQILDQLAQALRDEGGDLFAAMPRFFDRLRAQRLVWKELIYIMSWNMDLQQGAMLCFHEERLSMTHLATMVGRLHLRPDVEPEDLFTTLMRVSAPCLATAILEEDCGDLRARYCAQLEILQRGAQARDADKAKGE